MKTPDTREFAQQAGELVAILTRDGRVFQGRVEDVRVSSHMGVSAVDVELSITRPGGDLADQIRQAAARADEDAA